MTRLPFVIRLKEGKKEEGIKAFQDAWDEIMRVLEPFGAYNCSVWGINEFLFFYGEYTSDKIAVSEDEKAALSEKLSPYMEMFASPGTLPLMYHDIGIPRKDKSNVYHRVFATKLKEGCAAEYKRRHDVLIEQRGDRVDDPGSNFTIWNANGYIFGYCEMDEAAAKHERTEEEKAASIEWETKQFEIMDWLTDDTDWFTGEKHDHIALIAKQ